jgi:hypothetical protein
MAKTEATKRAEMMRKEWWKLKSTKATINDLIELGMLHNRELAGWQPADGDSYPNPQPSEIVVFEDFFNRGFGVPVHPFLQGLPVLRDWNLQSASQLDLPCFCFHPPL